MIRVMCFGTFDILHPGHISFLKKARAYGDKLYVIVSNDARRRTIAGGISPVHTQKERALLLQELRTVTQALPGHVHDILFHIKKVHPDIIVLGHDQVFGVDILNAWIRTQARPPKIFRLRAFKRRRYSTTRIKNELCKQM